MYRPILIVALLACNALAQVAGSPGVTGGASGGGAGTPCTTTALSVQFNSGGSLGCMAEFTFANHTLSVASAGILDMSAASVLAGLKFPTTAGAAPVADGQAAFNSTTHLPVWGFNGASTTTIPLTISNPGSNFLTTYNQATGAFAQARPACADLSNGAASCSTDATNATNIGSGTLNAARLPATAVLNNQANTYSAGLQSFSAGDLLAPVHSADPGTCTAGQFEFNSTGTAFKGCTATNTWTAFATGGAIAWSALTNPSGNLALTMAANTSTFNTTTAVTQFFKWANTTAALVGASQSSPNLALCGTEWHSAATAEGCVNFQFVPGTGLDAANTIAVTHTGTATGLTTTTFPGPIQAGTSGGVGGTLDLPEGTMAGGVSGHAVCSGESTAHAVKCSFNNDTAQALMRASSTSTTTTQVAHATATAGVYAPSAISTSDLPASVTQTIASGTSAMGTGAITSGTCATVVTTSATGTASTDAIIATPNADPTGVTGYAVSATGSLYIQAWPTTNNVNFKVCNNTSGSLTPAALTLNWRVVR